MRPFDGVVGKDNGTVESEVVLGKVHETQSFARQPRMGFIPYAAIASLQHGPVVNFAANYSDPDYPVNFAENWIDF